MIKQIMRIGIFFSLLISFTLVSCDKDTETPDEFSKKAINQMAIETRSGEGGCFELIYPVSVEFPDETIEAFESFEDLKEALKQWKAENPGNQFGNRPHLVFPIELINSEGELITVNNRKQLRHIVRKCKKGNHPKMKPCFRLEFPVNLLMPDGESITVDNRKQMKKTIRMWKKNNPDAEERPVLEFPVTIKYKDGTTEAVASKEALHQAKLDCD